LGSRKDDAVIAIIAILQGNTGHQKTNALQYLSLVAPKDYIKQAKMTVKKVAFPLSS